MAQLVETKLLYLERREYQGAEKPYFISGRLPPGTTRTNEIFLAIKTKITDARDKQFLLDNNSFECVEEPMKQDVWTEDGVEKYKKDLEVFLTKRLNASKVHAYHHVVSWAGHHK
jgi:methionine aminopeptidase